jgi:hypothetical protein
MTGNSDSVGAYVATTSNGSFTMPAGYACSAGTQFYLYALGGTSGSSTNAASWLLAAVRNCPNAGSFFTVNEATTIAAAYAFAGFALDATHVSSSGTALAQLGIANAFANAANLASPSAGAALATTPAGNGTAPQAEINSLANILANCVHSASCATLFATATSDGTSAGAHPAETATAAINIAHHPEANIAGLYALASLSNVFVPALGAVPNDLTIALNLPGGGLQSPNGIAIDGYGAVWIANESNSYPSVSNLRAAARRSLPRPVIPAAV